MEAVVDECKGAAATQFLDGLHRYTHAKVAAS